MVAHGCELIREGSDHFWWGHPATGKRSAVPRHTEIHKFLARKNAVKIPPEAYGLILMPSKCFRSRPAPSKPRQNGCVELRRHFNTVKIIA
jgi:hypothetical protein